ncbi:hypothetical protein SFUMM280S_11469 [Streptomyces fumanus]
MGFTIGRIGAPPRSLSVCTAVAEFTGLWGWDVVPGARAAGGACSCGRADCRAPGAHPLDFAEEIPAGSTLDRVTEAWGAVPGGGGDAAGRPDVRRDRGGGGRRAPGAGQAGAHGAAGSVR